MAEPILIQTGEYRLNVISESAVASKFESKFGIPCKSSQISYISIPTDFTFDGLSSNALIGYAGLLYDNTSNNSTYFIIGDTYASLDVEFKVSTKIALNLKYTREIHNISIYLFEAPVPDWKTSNLESQIQSYGISLGGLKETVFSNTAAGLYLSGEDSVNYKKFTPYLITVDRNSKILTETSIQKLKSQGVIGIIIEAGYLYNEFHTEQKSYMNPNLKRQVEILDSLELPYGLFSITRARSIFEAKKELEPLSTIVRAYPPKLGMWLKFSLSKYVSINNNIINEYYKQFVELGLMDQIGLYTTAFNLKQITWKNHQQWYLWLVEHVSSFVDLDQLLTPQFFKLSTGD